MYERANDERYIDSLNILDLRSLRLDDEAVGQPHSLLLKFSRRTVCGSLLRGNIIFLLLLLLLLLLHTRTHSFLFLSLFFFIIPMVKDFSTLDYLVLNRISLCLYPCGNETEREREEMKNR